MTQPSVPPVAERARRISPSKIREMFDLAQERDGDLVRLEIGEPDFETPDHIVDAACEAASAGATSYTTSWGLPALREAIADKMAVENDIHVDPDGEILVTTGAMEAIHVAVLATVDPGDEVVVPTPAWPNYAPQPLMCDAEVVTVPLPADDDFDLDPRAVIDAMSDDTAALLLCSPSNPTGRVFERNAVRDVVEAAERHDAYVITDEVYEGLNFVDDSTGIAAYTESDHVLTVNSFSKKYAMTGWRLGWLAGPREPIGAAKKIHANTTACAAAPSQHAGIEAIRGPQQPIDDMRAQFERRRDYVVNRIADVPELSCPPPEGGFYVFMDVSAFDRPSTSVARELLSEYGVVTVPGSAFGENGEYHLRLSFANSMERLEEGFDRIERMVEAKLR